MKQRVIVAIDSFKGCLTSVEANQAAADGFAALMPEADVIQIPVSDGGEGWIEAFRTSIGGETVELTVRDPLMRPVNAHYLINGDTAVIEIAQSSGLTLLDPEERNPMRATSYGTGQLVVDAVRRGCHNLIIGLGGSAVSDCGIGMIRAIIDNLAIHGNWNDVKALNDINFTIATDVTNPLCGKNGAAQVFAPQKGATSEMVFALDTRARHFAEVSARHFGFDRQEMPGAGAAGGLGYAFLQYMNATCISGIELLLNATHFDNILSNATLVVTGEGSADSQTLMGKLPYGILQRAQTHRVPVCLVAGRITDYEALLNAGFSKVLCINPEGLPLAEAIKPETAKRNIYNCINSHFQEFHFWMKSTTGRDSIPSAI